MRNYDKHNNKKDNGEEDPLDPYPVWLNTVKCAGCSTLINHVNFTEIGFYPTGINKGKLYIRYDCPSCESKGKLEYGDEYYTLERLCTLIIEQSKFLTQAQKIMWKQNHE